MSRRISSEIKKEILSRVQAGERARLGAAAAVIQDVFLPEKVVAPLDRWLQALTTISHKA